MGKLQIEAERLIIRNYQEKDTERLFDLLAHPRVNCFRDVNFKSLDDAKAEIEKANPEYDLAVCLKETDEFIGLLFGQKEEPDTFSPGWNFLPEYCGLGYATEAARAYFNYLFEGKGIRRIYAYTEDYNLASQGVCRKLGMRHEGTFKEFISFVKNHDGTPKYENTLQFAILKKEWKG